MERQAFEINLPYTQYIIAARMQNTHSHTQFEQRGTDDDNHGASLLCAQRFVW